MLQPVRLNSHNPFHKMPMKRKRLHSVCELGSNNRPGQAALQGGYRNRMGQESGERRTPLLELFSENADVPNSDDGDSCFLSRVERTGIGEGGGVSALFANNRQNPTSMDHRQISATSLFFERSDVRAWYRGDTEATSSLASAQDHEHPSLANSNPYVESPTIVTSEVSAGTLSPGTSGEDGVYTDDELSSMNARDAFVIPCAERVGEIQTEAIESMSAAAQEVLPCCICELSYDQTEITETEVTDSLVQQLKTCLAVPSSVPDAIIGQYSASHIDSRLKGLLLFPPAIQRRNVGVSCQLCKSCYGSIVTSKPPVLPVDAIANGNYIGRLPSRFSAMTRTDEQAVALVVPCVSVSVVTGGPCRTIKSHHYVVRNTEGPVTEMLPRDLSCRVRVTMVGAMTKSQVAACQKRYQLNLPLCRRFLHFLYLNNRHYLQFRESWMQGQPSRNSTIPTSLFIDMTQDQRQTHEAETCEENIRDEGTYSNFGSAVGEGDDPELENTWISASSVMMNSPLENGIDVIVRKSNDYVSTAKWAVCVKMFPTLFPCGCGGPTETRKKNMSVRRWILRCLRVHGHRFEKHYAFMLLAFDFLATQHARETLYIRMNVKRQALKAAEVKRSTVLEAIKYFNYLGTCRAKGIKPGPPLPEVQRVIDLRKGLRVPESAFYGSNLGRMRARHDLFGMLKRFGPLQNFFTISPNSAGTYTIAIKAGTVETKTIEEANFTLMPNRAERKMIAALYPVECARYFVRVMNTVIDSILGWNQRLQRPKRGGGIFGVVRAFGASAETQIAGDLHAHFAVWLHGFPTTSAAFTQKLTDDTYFYRRFLGLVDSVLTSKPPSLQNETSCARCHTDNTLTPIIPGVDAFRRPSSGTMPPTTASCSACGANFRDKDIIDASIQALADSSNKVITSQVTDFEKCRPPQLGGDDDLTTSLVVRDVQVHYWNHCRSCFKKTVRTPRGSVCRFLKPEAVNWDHTTINDVYKVVLHRPVGCEYVNAYNRAVMTSMKCNHDVQFVLNSGAKDTAAYIVKYCFKRQNPVENQAALSLAAFTKAAKKADTLPADAGTMERGYKILGSMLYTVTNGQEVAAPMAALYILNETPFWFSHGFIHVNLKEMLTRSIDSVEISVSQESCTNESSQNHISSDTLLEKYWKRQVALENVPFIDVCESYEYKVKKSRKSSDTDRLSSAYNFSPLDCVKVLVLCGNEIPDISSHQESDVMHFYYMAVLTLFKPHRRHSLLGSNQSPLCSYRSFLHNGDSALVQRMQQFEAQWFDYHRAQRSADTEEESAEEELLRTRAPPTTSWIPSDLNNRDTSFGQTDNTIPDDFFDSSIIAAPHLSTEKLTEDAISAVQGVPNLPRVIETTCDTYNSVASVLLTPDFNIKSYPSCISTSTAISNDDECLGTHDFIAQFKDAPTRLECLRECFEPVPHKPTESPRWSPSTLPPFPQIAMVSEAFELNFWQHVTFEVAARHLLYAYSQDIVESLSEPMLPAHCSLKPYNVKDQLIGYLGGEAGTGKSTVVNALLKFAKQWGRTGSVETLAFTGVAAINIKGRTMHSARNLKLNGAETNAAPTLEMKNRFRRVVLVIIDEISITGQGLLGSTDAVSRSMSLTPEKYMGGRHVLLIGDILQLPPVAGSPCFQAPHAQASRQRHAGYALYTAINFATFLTKNMRARFDPEYTKILDDLRWGRLSDDQLNLLNTRVQTTEESAIPVQNDDNSSYRPVVVCTNLLRCAINLSMIFQIARSHCLRVYESLARPSTRSKVIVNHLVNANDNLTDRIPMRLLFFVGMPVMITRKHPDLLEADIIANGVIGTIVGTFPQLDTLPTLQYEVSEVMVYQLLRPPALLLIRLNGVHVTLAEGFPEGVIGVPPLHARIRLENIPNLSQSSATVDQFAVVAAFACTTEKLQGQTCHDGIVVTPLNLRRAVPCQTLYVALSRAVSLAGLTLTEPITREYLKNFQPTQAVATEMQRLINLVSPPPYTSAEESISFDRWRATQHI